ncbi:MAG TPA: hypothetical protein VGP26_14135 [Actinophytocola sp.]|jgi:hypothetical protein|nr:hypothetical protein [Actinophytocola sp.]
MIAVLLLGVLLVLGILGLGVYLVFFRSSPPQEAGDPGPAPTVPTAPSTPASSAATSPRPGGTSEPGPGPGSSAAAEPGNTGALRSTARDYVDAVNDHDQVAATALTCDRANPGALYSVTDGREVRLGEVEIVAGAVGTAHVRVGDGETELLFEMQEDGWCVAI